jgi:membrane-associated phospholipid phosphatase
MNAIQKWSCGFISTAVAVVVSYEWLDRPIAFFAHGQLHQYDLFAKLTYIPEILTPLVLLIYAAIGLHALLGRKLPKLETVAVLAGVSVAVADAVKDKLKFAFGRTWPETWVRDNPSFIRDGVFGFNPFHGGPAFASFTSGHTTAICAVMTVLWMCYPRFRFLCALAIAAVAIGLVGADFHFLGDVVAGGFLGISTGWFTVVLWELGLHRVRADALCHPGQPSQRVQPSAGPMTGSAR